MAQRFAWLTAAVIIMACAAPAHAQAKLSPGEQSAVDASLRWLASHQSPDGRWDADGWSRNCPRGGCKGPGSNFGDELYDVGVTSLALQAFLAAGHSTTAGEHKGVVRAGLGYLWRTAEDGRYYDRTQGIPKPNKHELDKNGRPKRYWWVGWHQTYNHVMATHALQDAYALTGDPGIRPLARGSLEYCIKSQNPGLGWAYGPRSGRNNTTITGSMVHAIRAGRRAGFEVDDEVFTWARKWFTRATDSKGNVGYETPGGRNFGLASTQGKYDPLPVNTAVSVHARILTGERRSEDGIRKGARVLGENRPKWPRGGSTRTVNFFYWYHGTNAMFLIGGRKAEDWNKGVQGALLPTQRMGGCEDGSWDPVGEWCTIGGRGYATAINTLTLLASVRDDRLSSRGDAATDPVQILAGRREQAKALENLETVVRELGQDPAAKQRHKLLDELFDLRDKHSVPHVRRAASKRVADVFKAVGPKVIRQLSQHRSTKARKAAAEALGNFGAREGVVAALTKAFKKEADPFVRVKIADALGKLGRAAKPAEQALASAESHSEWALRKAAEKALTAIRTAPAAAAADIGVAAQEERAYAQAETALAAYESWADARERYSKDQDQRFDAAKTAMQRATTEIGAAKAKVDPTTARQLQALEASIKACHTHLTALGDYRWISKNPLPAKKKPAGAKQQAQGGAPDEAALALSRQLNDCTNAYKAWARARAGGSRDEAKLWTTAHSKIKAAYAECQRLEKRPRQTPQVRNLISTSKLQLGRLLVDLEKAGRPR